MKTEIKWKLLFESNGTFIRDQNGGLVASMEAGNQSKRDTDGKLCASAPELLDACKNAQSWLSRSTRIDDREIAEDLLAVINKAEGREG